MPEIFRQNPKFLEKKQNCLNILGKKRNLALIFKNAQTILGKTRNCNFKIFAERDWRRDGS